MTRKERKTQMEKLRQERLKFLTDRAKGGGQWALDQLRATEPEYVEGLVAGYTDLQKIVEEFLVTKIGGEGNLLFREGVRRMLNAERARLCGPDPSPLERVIVGRILICMLHAYRADMIDLGENPVQAQEIRDRTTRRLLRACRDLAEVRKLLGPNIQVNIADRQVNVMAIEAPKTDGMNCS